MNEMSKINIMLIPGIQGTGHFFSPLLRVLPDNFHSIVISYPDNILKSLEDHADYVAEHFPAGDIFIIAESFGGLVALMLLHRHPGKIQSIIFSATFSEALYPKFIYGASLIPGAPYLVKKMPVRILGYFLFRPYSDKNLEKLLKSGLPKIDPAGFKQRAKLVSEGYPYPDDYFSIPCLYLQSLRDRVVPHKSADWFASHFSPFELITFDAPHSLLQTRPRECAEKIINFIGRYKK
ncbi:MAG: alpha/beta fold hydrolase [Syntrophorhabdaceae bacterium]